MNIPPNMSEQLCLQNWSGHQQLDCQPQNSGQRDRGSPDPERNTLGGHRETPGMHDTAQQKAGTIGMDGECRCTIIFSQEHQDQHQRGVFGQVAMRPDNTFEGCLLYTSPSPRDNR